MEDTYHLAIKNLEQDNLKLQGEKDEKDQRINALIDNLTKLKLKISKKYCVKMDKACEAKFNLGDIKPKVQLMTNIFSDLKVTYVSGVPQKSSWLIAMINFILNQKLIQDLQTDFERRIP
jgi:hypothetical protein